jgi:hypothetical protein
VQLPPVQLGLPPEFVYTPSFVCVMEYASVSPTATVKLLAVSEHFSTVPVSPLAIVIEQDMAVLVPLCCTVTAIVFVPERFGAVT